MLGEAAPVRVGAALEKPHGGGFPTAREGRPERGLVSRARAGPVHGRAALEQQIDHREVAALGGADQRRRAGRDRQLALERFADAPRLARSGELGVPAEERVRGAAVAGAHGDEEGDARFEERAAVGSQAVVGLHEVGEAPLAQTRAGGVEALLHGRERKLEERGDALLGLAAQVVERDGQALGLRKRLDRLAQPGARLARPRGPPRHRGRGRGALRAQGRGGRARRRVWRSQCFATMRRSQPGKAAASRSWPRWRKASMKASWAASRARSASPRRAQAVATARFWKRRTRAPKASRSPPWARSTSATSSAASDPAALHCSEPPA